MVSHPFIQSTEDPYRIEMWKNEKFTFILKIKMEIDTFLLSCPQILLLLLLGIFKSTRDLLHWILQLSGSRFWIRNKTTSFPRTSVSRLQIMGLLNFPNYMSQSFIIIIFFKYLYPIISFYRVLRLLWENQVSLVF